MVYFLDSRRFGQGERASAFVDDTPFIKPPPTGSLCRDAASITGGVEGTDQQDHDRNDARVNSTDDAGGALSPGAWEDVTQSEAANATDASQAAAVERPSPSRTICAPPCATSVSRLAWLGR